MMSDFNLVTNEDQDHLLLATTQDARLDSLLSDEVVMQWLMDLEDEPGSSGVGIDAESSVKRMHA
jgi:hypothetical protein